MEDFVHSFHFRSTSADRIVAHVAYHCGHTFCMPSAILYYLILEKSKKQGGRKTGGGKKERRKRERKER